LKPVLWSQFATLEILPPDYQQNLRSQFATANHSRCQFGILKLPILFCQEILKSQIVTSSCLPVQVTGGQACCEEKKSRQAVTAGRLERSFTLMKF
jgi:hypothetical protein